MAQTVGLVQELHIFPADSFACAYIGPHPNNVEIFVVGRVNADSANVGAFKNSMVDALATALVDRREVVAFHDGDGVLLSLSIYHA